MKAGIFMAIWTKIIGSTVGTLLGALLRVAGGYFWNKSQSLTAEGMPDKELAFLHRIFGLSPEVFAHIFIDRSRRSPNFNSRRDTPIDMVVIHCTNMDSWDSAIARLCDPVSEVSSHYVIAQDGRIFGLIDEAKRAWHAGVAEWQGQSHINDRSLGIELDYPGHRAGLQPYPEAQIFALIALLRDIRVRHDIPAQNVLGHEDVAPGRKVDPGENFPWQRLIEAGVAARG